MNINRAEIKLQARMIVGNSKPSMLTAGLIYTLLSAVMGWLSLRLTGIDSQTMTKAMSAYTEGNFELTLNILSRAMPSGSESLLDFLLRLALTVVSVGFCIFTLNTIRNTNPQLGNLLDAFGMLGKTVLLILLQYLLIFLWSCLLIIPGVIAAYRYSLAYYVLIDHPEMSPLECLRESKRLTQGYKKELFYLDLSFILWLLLISLPVVGYAVQVFVMPWYETSRAMYYEVIRHRDGMMV